MVHQGKAVSGDGGESGLLVIGDWELGRCMGLKYWNQNLLNSNAVVDNDGI